jgi:hypothetical protein
MGNIYYVPALNSGLVHIWATFIMYQHWVLDWSIYEQHLLPCNEGMMFESICSIIVCLYNQYVYQEITCMQILTGNFLCLWHAEVAHNTRKVKRVLGNRVTRGMIYICCAVCTAIQFLDHELWHMIICFCCQICQRWHNVSLTVYQQWSFARIMCF